MFKGIIFDFDGVIVDTEPKKFKYLRNILRKYKYNLEKDSFLDLIGKKTSKFLAEKFPQIPEETIKIISKIIRKLRYVNIQEYKLIPGIQELLVFLKSKRYKIAVTTGSERNFIEKILKNHSILDYFDVIVSGEEFNSSKPDPECYQITIKKLNLLPSKIIIVEDSVPGIKAAKTLGCNVFAIKTYLKRNSIFETDKVFKDHFDILKYLK